MFAIHCLDVWEKYDRGLLNYVPTLNFVFLTAQRIRPTSIYEKAILGFALNSQSYS